MIQLTISQARRFLLRHQMLFPARQLAGKAGILTLMHRLANIQFDPIDVVGRNAELVLQSRIADYQPSLLNELLYQERLLWDGWDKMQGIYLASDWHYFARQRAAMRKNYANESFMSIAPQVLDAIETRGALSSLDFEGERTTDWWWGPQKPARAALEVLYAMGEIGVARRVASRRYFDLTERLLPLALLRAPEPHAQLSDYQDWHILRRLGSLGLSDAGSGEHWLGIRDTKSAERQAGLNRLLAQGKILTAQIPALPRLTLYLRQQDEPTLQESLTETQSPATAAFIAPLDNLIWNRKLIAQLFDFSYTWEVYTPPAKRRYGYYVLPVLYGERFVARADLNFDKKTRTLCLNGWWWEAHAEPTTAMSTALHQAWQDFARYLGAVSTTRADHLNAPHLDWL